MWFIGVEGEQETSAPPPKKKILDPPLRCECCQTQGVQGAETPLIRTLNGQKKVSVLTVVRIFDKQVKLR